jgi:Ca2+-binding EF-hand superfamily protein
VGLQWDSADPELQPMPASRPPRALPLRHVATALVALLALYGAWTLAFAAPADTMAAAFKRADTNGDGKLSKAEAAIFPVIAERFDALDKDKDGFLTPVEFSAAG